MYCTMTAALARLAELGYKGKRRIFRTCSASVRTAPPKTPLNSCHPPREPAPPRQPAEADARVVEHIRISDA